VRLRILLAFAATWFIWGSTYLVTAFAVRDLPPFLLSGVRNTLAGLLIYGFLRARGAARPTRAQWGTAVIVGVSLLALGNGSVTWASQREPSGVIALIVSLVPLWLLVFGWFGAKGVRPSGLEVSGVLLGLVGIALLVAPHEGGGNVSPMGLAVLLMSTVFWAGGSLYSRTLPKLPVPLIGTGMEMLMGGAVMLAVSAATGEWSELSAASFTPRAMWSLAYLVLAGSILGFTAYKWLLANVRPALAGTYAFINPVVAMLLGWLFAGEALTGRLMLAMATIVGAVAMISLRPYLNRR
jgi:drug/metabolite transporter (DMT)-like permease